MGVERQGAKINWITSIAMVVLAGTFYRARNVLSRLNKITVQDIREQAGLLYKGKQ